MNNNKKLTIAIVSILLISSFFMPWFKFFVQISAWDLVFSEMSQNLANNTRYLLLLLPVSGLIVLLGIGFNNGKYILPPELLFITPLLSNVILAAIIADNLNNFGIGNHIDGDDVLKILKNMGIGFWISIISSLIYPFIGNYSAFKNQTTDAKPTVADNVNNTNENNGHSSSQETFSKVNTRPQININLPKIDLRKTFNPFILWLSKHKIKIIVTIAVLIAIKVSYNLFIRPDPVKDGSNFAKQFCTCNEEFKQNYLTTFNSLNADIDAKKYKSRIEAKDAFNTAIQKHQMTFEACIKKVEFNMTEKLADYKFNSNDLQYSFNETYNNLKDICRNSSENERNNLLIQVDEKINTIIDPYPDTVKIKNDLIGYTVNGWNFQSVDEIKKIEIMNVKNLSEGIELQIKMSLLDIGKNSPHECEVFLNYTNNDGNWFPGGIKLNYLTYTNTFYNDQYVSITLLNNCTWEIDNSHKLSWKTSGWFSEEFISGPGLPLPNLQGGTTINVKSLDANNVKVIFTYRPILNN